MSLIYKRKANNPGFSRAFYDYFGEIKPFAKRVKSPFLVIPMILLKSIEWSIYRWYKTPIRRFYGVKGNELIFMITKRCNERCPKCGIWKDPEPNDQHLEISYFINTLRRLHYNLYQVTLTGGEPLLFKDDVLLIAKEAAKLKVPMVVVTNGCFLDEKFLIQYKNLGHILVISVDSVNNEKWKEFRGKNTFDLVMPKILLSKKILGDKLRIQSVLSKESELEIPEVVDFCKSHNIQHNIQLVQDFGGNWVSASEGFVTAEDNISCAARKNVCIYPNGDVVKCFDHRRIPIAKEPLGNIAKTDIIEILCTRRSTEVSRTMKYCNYPCKSMSCNKPQSFLFN